MRSLPRSLWLSLCLAAPGCLGGPTSDWPKGAQSADDDDTSEPEHSGKDAGRGGARRDAGASLIDAGRASPNGVCSPGATDGGGMPAVETGDGGVPADASAAADAQIRSAVEALEAADGAADLEPASDAGVSGCEGDGT